MPRQERLEVVAVEQRDPEAHQGGQDRELEAAEEELGGEEAGHGGGKVGGTGRKDGRPRDATPEDVAPERLRPLALILPPMSDSVIRIVNARQNNLQGITVELPHRALIVITGPSGSGKSTLAFDTLYAEGQRRYIESLSTYAKQFLERMPKPLVDRLEGIAPSVAIEQRNPDRLAAGPPSAPPPRSTTTSGCSGPASAGATAARAARRSGGTRRRSAADDVAGRACPARGSGRLSAARRSRGSPTRRWSRTCARSASSACWPTARRTTWTSCPPGSTSPGAASCWWWWTG